MFFPGIIHGWRLIKKLKGRGIHVESVWNPPFSMWVDAIIWYDNLCNWVQELKGSIWWWIGFSLMMLLINVIQFIFNFDKKFGKMWKSMFSYYKFNQFFYCNLRNFCQILDTTKLESNNIFSVVVITFICTRKLYISIDACIQIINSKCK